MLFKNLIFLATAATALVSRQATSLVLSDLQYLDVRVNKLTNSVAYGPIASPAIQVNVDQVLSATNKAAGDAAGPIAEPDAQVIVDFISNVLQPDAIKAVSAIDSRRLAFQSVLLGPVVISDLKKLKARSAVLGEALTAAIPENAEQLATLFGSVDVAIKRAIDDFSL